MKNNFIILSDIKKDDMFDVLEIRNDDSTRKNLENDTQFTLEQGYDWFDTTLPQWKMISVQNKTSYYNNIGYVRIDGNTIGIDVHPNFRRQGIAKKAYNLMLPQKKEWQLWVFEDNTAKQLYEELGFYYTGDQGMKRDKLYLHMRYKNI